MAEHYSKIQGNHIKDLEMFYFMHVIEDLNIPSGII